MTTGTTAKPETKPAPETKLREAIIAWKAAEGSAIWKIIHECRILVEKKHTKTQLKTYLDSGFEDAFGAGASKKRAAHISKIIKIAMEAKPEDFDRWKKDGTGFYKAYEEYATPQENPAGKQNLTVGAKAEPQHQVKTVGEGSSGDFVASEEQVAAQNAALDDPDAMAAEQIKSKTPTANQVEAANKAKVKEAQDPTANWATQIDKRRDLWPSLLKEMKDILTPSMVIDLFTILHTTSQVKFRNTIELLLQEQNIAAIATDFLENYGDLNRGADKKLVEKDEESDEEEDDDEQVPVDPALANPER